MIQPGIPNSFARMTCSNFPGKAQQTDLEEFLKYLLQPKVPLLISALCFSSFLGKRG